LRHLRAGLAKVKVAEVALEDKEKKENLVETQSGKPTTTQRDISADFFRQTTLKSGAPLNRRPKRSYAPEETFAPADRRYRRLTWKRRPWGEVDADADVATSLKSSVPDSGSLLYLVSSSSDINTDNQKNSFEQKSDSDNKDCSESFTSDLSDDTTSPDASQPLKRVDRSLTSDLLASAGNSIARNFMKRRRGGRMYDVPQIGESNLKQYVPLGGLGCAKFKISLFCLFLLLFLFPLPPPPSPPKNE